MRVDEKDDDNDHDDNDKEWRRILLTVIYNLHDTQYTVRNF